MKSLDMISTFDTDLLIEILYCDYKYIKTDNSRLWRLVHLAQILVEPRLWEFEKSNLLSGFWKWHWILTSFLAPKDGGQGHQGMVYCQKLHWWYVFLCRGGLLPIRRFWVWKIYKDVRSDGERVAELIEKHIKDIRKVLKPLEENQLVERRAKSAFFRRELELLDHVFREEVRKSSPGNLLPLQKWVILRTITDLRGFLSLTNYSFRVWQVLFEIFCTTHGQVAS